MPSGNTLFNQYLINDTIGHQAADQVLRSLAESLNFLIRTDDLLGLYTGDKFDATQTITVEPIGDSVLSRLGGDEFIVLLPDTRDRFAAGNVARRILNHLGTPIRVDGHEVFVTASIGIATYPEDGLSSEILIRNADTAMYHAKQEGKALPLQQEGATSMAVLPGAADFSVALDTGMPLGIEAGRASFSLPVPAAGSVRLSLVIPGEHTNVHISPGLITNRASDSGQTTVEATLAPGQPANIWWATRESAAPVAPPSFPAPVSLAPPPPLEPMEDRILPVVSVLRYDVRSVRIEKRVTL